MRILYVQATLVPPPVDRAIDRFFLLSEALDGDVLQPVWFKTPQEVEAIFGAGSWPVHTVGRFRYHWFLAYRHPWGVRQRLAIFLFYLRKGWEVCRKRRPDCIVAYSHMTTALVAGVLKLMTGVRLIPEIATSPEHVYLTDRPKPTLADRIKHAYSDLSLHLSLLMADRVHLLSPGQLAAYPLLRRVRNSVFHEFVPVSKIDRPGNSETKEPYILLVGSPWYLKGVDLLIEAFRNFAPDFPGVKLKLLGHFPDQTAMEALTGGSPDIEILQAVPNPEALRLIAGARVLVLPSRCEGMGRVLIEGMAAGVPLIGSDVGGIPYMIRDGENGYLFPRGDSRALESRLRGLLADAGLRLRMGDCGYHLAHRELNESVYVKRFAAMVAAACGKPEESDAGGNAPD